MKNPITFLRGTVIIIISSILLLVTYIFFSNNNTFGLVEKDYYQQAINYQQQIERERGANLLDQKVNVAVSNNIVLIKFPYNFTPSTVKGEIIFFRPSDLNLDFKISIDLNENNIQFINTIDVQQGAWIVQIYWNVDTNKYYSEKRIFIEK